MAYEANFTGTYSGRAAYRIRLYVRRNDTSGNSSTYAWWLYAEQTAAGTAFSSNATPWAVNIGGHTWSGTGTQDFRNTNSILLGSGIAGWFGHDTNGNLSFGVSASHNGDTPIGGASTSGTFVADRIAQVPAAPTPIGISDVKSTSFMYQFSGNGDGGSAITGWEIQYAKNSGFTGATTVASGGTSTLTGLTPGTTYYVRSRGGNAVGWGPYSSVSTATTRAGGKRNSGGTFLNTTIAKRLSGTTYVDLTIAKRFNGTAWVDLT